MLISLAIGNLLSPMVLFFALGVAAGWLKSDLAIPESISKGLLLYLMLAIAFKGGVELASNGVGGTVALAMVLALALRFSLPLLAYGDHRDGRSGRRYGIHNHTRRVRPRTSRRAR